LSRDKTLTWEFGIAKRAGGGPLSFRIHRQPGWQQMNTDSIRIKNIGQIPPASVQIGLHP
jgi:hypothetical protein